MSTICGVSDCEAAMMDDHPGCGDNTAQWYKTYPGQELRSCHDPHTKVGWGKKYYCTFRGYDTLGKEERNDKCCLGYEVREGSEPLTHLIDVRKASALRYENYPCNGISTKEGDTRIPSGYICKKEWQRGKSDCQQQQDKICKRMPDLAVLEGMLVDSDELLEKVVQSTEISSDLRWSRDRSADQTIGEHKKQRKDAVEELHRLGCRGWIKDKVNTSKGHSSGTRDNEFADYFGRLCAISDYPLTDDQYLTGMCPEYEDQVKFDEMLGTNNAARCRNSVENYKKSSWYKTRTLLKDLCHTFCQHHPDKCSTYVQRRCMRPNHMDTGLRASWCENKTPATDDQSRIECRVPGQGVYSYAVVPKDKGESTVDNMDPKGNGEYKNLCKAFLNHSKSDPRVGDKMIKDFCSKFPTHEKCLWFIRRPQGKLSSVPDRSGPDDITDTELTYPTSTYQCQEPGHSEDMPCFYDQRYASKNANLHYLPPSCLFIPLDAEGLSTSTMEEKHKGICPGCVTENQTNTVDSKIGLFKVTTNCHLQDGPPKDDDAKSSNTPNTNTTSKKTMKIIGYAAGIAITIGCCIGLWFQMDTLWGLGVLCGIGVLVGVSFIKKDEPFDKTVDGMVAE